MNRLTRSLALVLASTWSTLLCAQAAPEPVRAQTIRLYNGEVKLLPVAGVRRVAVGNGKLLSVTNLPKQLIMIGTGVGDTNMLVWNHRGEVMAYNIDISAQDTQQTAENLRESLGGIPGLRVESRGGEVVLAGDVTPEAEKQIGMLARHFKGVINLTHGVTVDMKRMVYLDVQVVDFKKSVLKNLGINWQQSMSGPVLGLVGAAIDNPFYHIGDLTQGGQRSNQLQGNGGTLTGLPNQMPFSRYFGITTSLSSVINLAVQNGDAYVLANPQLSTRSGGDATFLAGGEVPIPVSSALGQTTVEYKNYGVKLNIQPVADRYGNIEATVDTEVSQIDPSVVIQGYPGFLTRKTSSMVNVHSGQTIVMSGLVQATGANTLTKFPWLGDVPIIGALFRDRNFQSSRDELVIFVTPKVFNPDSRINREVVHRGVRIAHQFNDSSMGRPVWMPGFGIGPASHLPRPRGGGPEDTSGPQVMGGTGVAAPATQAPAAAPPPAPPPAARPAAAPPPLTPATTQPLRTGPLRTPPPAPAPASSTATGTVAVPVDVPRRATVSAPALEVRDLRMAAAQERLPALARPSAGKPAATRRWLPLPVPVRVHAPRMLLQVADVRVATPALDRPALAAAVVRLSSLPVAFERPRVPPPHAGRVRDAEAAHVFSTAATLAAVTGRSGR